MSKKIIEKNKKAFFDYFIEDTFEAGIVLEGNEVKSIRMQNVSIKDAFCRIENGEMWLKNCLITPYSKGSVFNAEQLRDRKLLLHRSEIDKIAGKIKSKGYTLVPTLVYITGNKIKLEIALCKGKQLYDKREAIKERDVKRQVERAIKEHKN